MYLKKVKVDCVEKEKKAMYVNCHDKPRGSFFMYEINSSEPNLKLMTLDFFNV